MSGGTEGTEGTEGLRAQRWGRVAGAGAAWLVGMFTMYREAITSGFGTLHGGDLDQRLLVYLSEHWFGVMGGDASWRDPSMFFPVTDDLGYTDALVLFQVTYAPLRLLGFDPFLSFEVTLMALTTIGFVATVLLVHRVMKVQFAVAVIAAFVFAFGNHIAVQTQHGQLLAIGLVPVVGLGVAGAVGRIRRRQPLPAALLAGGTGALVGLILFTSYYVGWFMVGATVLATLCVAACAPSVVTPTVRRLRAHGWSVVLVVTCGFVGLAVALVPFAITYQSALEQSGGRTFDEVAYFTPRVANLIAFGDANVVWGQALPALPGVTDDIITVPAPTPVLVVTAIMGLLAMLIHTRSRNDLAVMRLRLQVAAGLLLASALMTGASVRIGEWTAWRWVWQYVPGAAAIRVPGRIGMTVTLLVVLAWALVADAVWSAIRPWVSGTAVQRSAAVAVIAAGLLVAVEQVQTGSVHDLIRTEQVAMMDAVGAAPPGCAAFHVVNPAPANPPWVDQMDAMLISHAAGLPTLNGYSGLTPSGWELNDPDSPDYQQAARAWISRHSLDGSVCTYDLTAQRWNPSASP